MKRPTLKDIAREVGVHVSTISRALNGGSAHAVSPDLARKIWRASKRRGYTPNTAAVMLKTNRSRTVGVIVPDITDPVFPPIIRGIEDGLAGHGYVAILTNSDGDPRRQVVGEAGDRLGAELRVEHHDHGAVLERAEQGADELGAVRQRQEYPLLAPQAETGEDVGEAIGQPLDLPIGEIAVGQPQRDALAAPLGDALVEQPGREVELLGRNEGHLSSGVGADSTGAPSGIMRG